MLNPQGNHIVPAKRPGRVGPGYGAFTWAMYSSNPRSSRSMRSTSS
jgi:hypothetical protein